MPLHLPYDDDEDNDDTHDACIVICKGRRGQRQWDDYENDDDEDNNIAWADSDCMATARDKEDDNN